MTLLPYVLRVDSFFSPPVLVSGVASPMVSSVSQVMGRVIGGSETGSSGWGIFRRTRKTRELRTSTQRGQVFWE